MPIINRHVANLKLSLRAIAEQASKTPGCIRADLGMPGFAPPNSVRTVIASLATADITSYAPLYGDAACLAAINHFERKKFGAYIDPKTLITAGGQAGLYSVFSTFLEPGDEVIVPLASYAPYTLIANILGAKTVPSAPENLSQAITPQTKIIILCAPNNPSGSVYSVEQLQIIADQAKKNDCVIVSDDVYDKLWWGATEIPHIVAYAPERTICLNSVSKMLALPGFRTGWLIGEAALIETVAVVHRAMNSCPNTLAQKVVAEILLTTEPYLVQAKNFYQAATSKMARLLRAKGWHVETPPGGLYVWAKHPDITDGWSFVQDLITIKKVSAIPGEAFGAENKGFIRFAAGALSLEQIDLLVERL
jgi:aspartate/methionine/tyrosine aminotransferase